MWNDKKSNSGGWQSLKGNDSWYSSFLKDIEEKQEEDEKKRQIDLQKQQGNKEAKNDDKKGHDWWRAIGNFTEEANKKIMGGAVKDIASAVNFVGSGFNGEEADKRTKDFMKTTGMEDEKGLSTLEKYNGNPLEDTARKMAGQSTADSFMTDEEEDAEVQENKEDFASQAGAITGNVLKTGLDIGTIALPGVAAEKALRGTKAAQALLNGGKAKSIAGEAGLSIAGGAASTGVGALKDPESLTGDQVAQNVGIDAAIGIAAPGLGAVVGALRNAKNSKELANTLNGSDLNVPDEVRTQLQTLAESGLSGKKFKAEQERLLSGLETNADILAREEAEAAELLKRPMRDVPEEELRAQIDEFMAGGGRLSDDVQADYNRIQTIKDELSLRERENYYANGGVTKAEAQKALDDFDAGNVPDSAYKPAAPVSSLDEVLQRDDIPAEIKSTAEEVFNDKVMVQQQLDNLMSPMTKEAEIERIDEMYEMQLQELQQRYSSVDPTTPGGDGQRLSGDYKSDVRFTVAKDKLDEDYRNQMAELDMLEAQDADEVEKYMGILDKLETAEQAIVLDTRRLMEASPDSFRDIDEVEAGAIRGQLEEQLRNAERFDDPKGIVAEAATSPNPAQSLRNNPDGERAVRGDLVESTSHLEGFQNASRVRQAVMGLMSPSKNLEAMGLRDLADNVMTADAKQQLANKADIATISEIAKRLKGNDQLGDQIIDYLEGNRQTLSAADQETADMIRGFLDEKRAWLQENGFATMDDYFPHLFDKKAEGVQRLFKGKTTGDISFANLKERKSDSPDYSRDIVDVLATYAQGFNKKKFLEPALKPLENVKTVEKITTAEANWIDEYINQLKGTTKASDIENGFNNLVDGVLGKTGSRHVGGNHYRALLGGQRMLAAVSTMGLNPGTAIRNMTQTVNTVAAIGPKWSSVGLARGTRALRAPEGSPEHIEMAEAGVFSGGISKNYNADLDEYSTKIPGIRGGINKGANMMMFMVSKTDAFMRAQAYWGAKALAESKGMSDDAAKAFAREKVVDTQFITSKVDMPTKLNGPAMRSLTQLATFSAKQAEFLGSLGVKLVKGDNGSYKFSRPEQAVNLLSAAMAAGLATAVLEPVIGFEAEEFIPFSPQVEAFMGEGGSASDALYRSPLLTLMLGDGKGKSGLLDVLKPTDQDKDKTATHGESMAEFLRDQWTAFIPGGTQLKKTVEGGNTTAGLFGGEAGVSRNKNGQIKYLQDMDVDDTLKATLFGQYATDAGKSWIREGFPTLTDKQTQKVDEQQGRDAKQQYVDFYQVRKAAGAGRQSAYDEVKAAAKAGDVNKAQRLANEFNERATKAMGKYWREHDTMPQELQDAMLSELYINVDRVIDNVEDDE